MKEKEKFMKERLKFSTKGQEKNTAIQYFKDDATAFNNLKKSTIEGKGILTTKYQSIFLKT